MLVDVEKTKEYLKTEFGIETVEELEEACEKTSDIDIGLFVTPIFGKKGEWHSEKTKEETNHDRRESDRSWLFSIPLHGFGAGWPRMEDSCGRSDYRRGNYENRSGYSKNGGTGICVVFV